MAVSFLDLNSDMQTHGIAPYLHPKAAFGLSLTCRALTHLPEEFFKQACLAHFPELPSISQFIEPLLQTVDKPWRWICYSLGCVKVNGEFFPIAQRIAKSSLNSFRIYFLKFKTETESEKNWLEKLNQSICGNFHQDPGSKIHIAWKSYEDQKAKITKQMAELLRQCNQRDIGYYEYLLKEIAAQMGREKGAMTFLPPDPDDDDDATLRKLVQWNMIKLEESIARSWMTIKSVTTDPAMIQLFELFFNLTKANEDYTVLEFQRKTVVEKIPLIIESIQLYGEIENHHFEQYYSDVVYHILAMLPHLKIWAPHFPKVAILKNEIQGEAQAPNSSPTRLHSIRGLINSLPQPLPNMIWDGLYNRSGNGAEKHQMFFCQS